MTHTYEKLSSNKAKLTFTVPAADFEAAMQKAYLKMRGRINVNGFRKGKAPRHLIEKMYGEAVFYDDALDLIFREVYPEAVKAEDIHPVDRPDVDVQEIGEGKDLQFSCEVFVRPDVELGEYKGLTVKREAAEVTDEQVKAEIEKDQEKVARVVDVTDRAVEDGDIVNLDYAGSVDGVPFAGGTAEGQTLTIGSKMFIEGFEEQMIGMTIGEEKDLSVTFPEQYHSEELAGKAAVFHVKVNGIQKKEMPALDDDFAADVSDFSTYAEYENDKRAKLTETAEKNADNKLENDLIEKAVENAKVEIPQAMIEDQIDNMIQEMKMRMAYQGLRYEDYLKYTNQNEEAVRAMYKEEAGVRVKTDLVLQAIKNAENVEPTEEEVAAQTKEQAERMGRKVEDFEKSLTEQQKEFLKDTAAIQKVIDLMKDSAVIEK